MNGTRKRIEARWGIPFWDLLSDICGQGFNRTQAAAIVGMQRQAFSALLMGHPERNPWGTSNIVATYVRDTGEPFRDALLRMQAHGYSLCAASKAIGFAGVNGLKHAMRARGIELVFTHTREFKPPKKAHDRGPNVTKGWPTWEKIYEIGGGPLPEFRRKKKCQTAPQK